MPSSETGSFSAIVWSSSEILWRSIAGHPFNRELAQGTLDPRKFHCYLVQDEIYLSTFTRVLLIAASRAGEPNDAAFLVRVATESLAMERAMHADLLPLFGVPEQGRVPAEPSPACLAYGSFLLATGYAEPMAVLVAALQPCFRVYWEVGRLVAARSVPGNRYQEWIDTYAGDEYAATVAQFERLTDRLASAGSNALRARMHDAFRTSMRYEWMFWEGAWRDEQWPDRRQQAYT